MQNSMISAAVAGLVGAVAAIAVGATGVVSTLTGSGLSVKRMTHATIYLDLLPNSDCVITTTPQLLEVYKKETVQWSIVDRCGLAAATEVEIEFTSGDPLETGCVHKGKKKIQCALNPASNGGAYKYKVKAAGATTEDPDLEIVQ